MTEPPKRVGGNLEMLKGEYPQWMPRGIAAILPRKDLLTQPSSETAGIDGATPKGAANRSTKTKTGESEDSYKISSRNQRNPCCIPAQNMETQPESKDTRVDGATIENFTHLAKHWWNSKRDQQKYHKIGELTFHTRGDTCRPNQGPKIPARNYRNDRTCNKPTKTLRD